MVSKWSDLSHCWNELFKRLRNCQACTLKLARDGNPSTPWCSLHPSINQRPNVLQLAPCKWKFSLNRIMCDKGLWWIWMEVSTFQIPGNSSTKCWIQWWFHMISLRIPIKECKLLWTQNRWWQFFEMSDRDCRWHQFGWYDTVWYGNSMNSSGKQTYNKTPEQQLASNHICHWYLKFCNFVRVPGVPSSSN